MYVYVCVCMHMCVYLCMYVYVCVHVFMCMYMYVYLCMYVCVCCVSVCVCVYPYMCGDQWRTLLSSSTVRSLTHLRYVVSLNLEITFYCASLPVQQAPAILQSPPSPLCLACPQCWGFMCAPLLAFLSEFWVCELRFSSTESSPLYLFRRAICCLD